MTFIYSQSFIYHFMGLFETSMMISSQLAFQLCWQSSALVSQRSWVQIPCRPEFFSGLAFSSVHHCEDHFHIHVFIVQIYDFHIKDANIYDFHIFPVIFLPLHTFIWNQHADQLPVGLLAQLVEHCTSIPEIMGSNPIQA